MRTVTIKPRTATQIRKALGIKKPRKMPVDDVRRAFFSMMSTEVPMSRKDFAAAVGVSSRRQAAMLRSMVEQGVVVEPQKGQFLLNGDTMISKLVELGYLR
jgi:hypothetical protein